MSMSRTIFKSAASGFAVGLVVFMVDASLEYLLLARGISHTWTLFISDAIAAMVAGFFATYTFILYRQREAEVKERLDRVVEMNHHVRNALQVITYWSLAERDKREVDMIHQAVDRIEWALREVLPQGLGMGAPLRRGPQSEGQPQQTKRRSSTSA
jgi:hypothetical protein